MFWGNNRPPTTKIYKKFFKKCVSAMFFALTKIFSQRCMWLKEGYVTTGYVSLRLSGTLNQRNYVVLGGCWWSERDAKASVMLGLRANNNNTPSVTLLVYTERDAVGVEVLLLVGRLIPPIFQQHFNNSVTLHLLQANTNNPIPMLELPTHMVGVSYTRLLTP